MKNLLFAVLILPVLQSQAQSEKSIQESDIKEVKVYTQGALITRHVKTNINSGLTKLTIELLSPYINSASINVNGTGEAIILSVVSEINYLNEQRKTPDKIGRAHV